MPSTLWGNKRSSNIGPTRNVTKTTTTEVSTSTKYTGLPRTASSRPRARMPQVRSHSDLSASLSTGRVVAPRKRSPVTLRIESDSDDSDDEDEPLLFDTSSQMQYRIAPVVPADSSRDLASSTAFHVQVGTLIHAIDIASRKLGFLPAFGPTTEDLCVQLQYPGSPDRERYELVIRNNEFNPIKEIIDIVQVFANFFLTADQVDFFLNPDSGIKRKLERYSSDNIRELIGFKSTILAYNSEVDRLRVEGSLLNNISAKHAVPFTLVERIMLQAYDRAVSPKVDLLKKYENGTDHVYGELKNGFVFNILAETQLTSDQVFVDLGSGVANVVLQAALQVGCESWGCEIMPDTCDIAEDYRVEFEARCSLWGVKPGQVKLERGDFTENDNIREVLRRADVILVNNRVFTPALNNTLVNLFLDCKDGCKIVSLGSFVPPNHQIKSYNLNNPVNLLEVEQKSYPARSVSWTHKDGEYFISTKDSKRLQRYGHLG